jgi:prolyl-tRNA editing enzyme YbaK/EbsC (Cys-tRNA(Pro) deacylase)
VLDVTRPAITRLVDAAALKGVALDIRPLPSSATNAELVAAAVEAEIGQVVTALLFVADHGSAGLAPVVYLQSGSNPVDPCLLAALTGELSLRPATAAEALVLTGQLPGRMPAFGFGHSVRTLMDAAFGRYQWVWAPAGSIAAVFRMGVPTLRALSSAVVVPIPFGSDPRKSLSTAERRHMPERRQSSRPVTRRTQQRGDVLTAAVFGQALDLDEAPSWRWS